MVSDRRYASMAASRSPAVCRRYPSCQRVSARSRSSACSSTGRAYRSRHRFPRGRDRRRCYSPPVVQHLMKRRLTSFAVAAVLADALVLGAAWHVVPALTLAAALAVPNVELLMSPLYDEAVR